MMKGRLLAPALTGAALLAMIALLDGCGEERAAREDAAVPLPKAWPRTALYDTVRAPFAGTDIEVNTGATATAADGGITVAYPAYRSTLYISDTRAASPDALREAEANRLERISLNIGGRRTEMKETAARNGFSLRIFVTPQGTLTPLQFIAVGPGRIVSGTLVTDRLPVSADSLRPTLDAVEADILHLTARLRDK